MKSRKYTDQQIDQIRQLYLNHVKISEIADICGISIESVRYIVRVYVKERRPANVNKVGQRHNRAKLTDRQVMQLLELVGMGEKWTEIAMEFGIHDTTARDIAIGKSRTNNPEINERRKIALEKRAKLKSK